MFDVFPTFYGIFKLAKVDEKNDFKSYQFHRATTPPKSQKFQWSWWNLGKLGETHANGIQFVSCMALDRNSVGLVGDLGLSIDPKES